MKKQFLTEYTTPDGNGVFGGFNNLSEIKNNRKRIVCYTSDMETGMKCPSCSTNEFAGISNLSKSKIRDKDKGEFIHSFTCTYNPPDPANPPVVCVFIGDSDMTERT
jgi:hypothetical protein